MGLDMYLDKSVYVGANYSLKNMKVDIHIEDSKGNVLPINPEKIRTIREEFGYWRKANAIHDWFVKNVQDGVDNCGTYYVSKDELQELKDNVVAVLTNHSRASELLPVSDGFFFGSTEYDDWYFSGLKDTKKILEEALEILENNNCVEFYYHSSW
jgi:hypothetical protein